MFRKLGKSSGMQNKHVEMENIQSEKKEKSNESKVRF
jgi:hypothetical protein